MNKETPLILSIYIVIASIVGAYSFLWWWIYYIYEWGFWLGILFGEFPAGLHAIVDGLLWPVILLFKLLG